MSASTNLEKSLTYVQRHLDEIDRTSGELLGAILVEREKLPSVKQAEADLDYAVNQQLVKDMQPPNGVLSGLPKSSEAFRTAIAARREELARSLPEYKILQDLRADHWKAGTIRERAQVAFSAASIKATLLAGYLGFKE